jgi:hypothetical protein
MSTSKKNLRKKTKIKNLGLSLHQSNDVRLSATNRTFWVTPNPEPGAFV